ncbi:carbon-phosphorus lyase complex subunit PhnI [Streptomyces sp. NPDC001508]|uniref:carbon-phosphorus lyase complex subunit PhnI n=1 Tax=Streptomyces sp. NPDC001508 TaxID=3154656 RepID=UPI003333BBE3
MSYSTYKEDAAAISAVQRLAAKRRAPGVPGELAAHLPLLFDQIQGEAGLFAPTLVERALSQAQGDVGRAVGLLRGWAAVLPHLVTPTLSEEDVRVVRRLTPAFRNPEHGQYLGASPDHAPRLLQTDDTPEQTADVPEPEHAVSDEPGSEATDGPCAQKLLRFPRAVSDLETSGILKHGSGTHSAPHSALLATLAQGDTGALTTIAYAAARTFGSQREPIVGELRAGYAPVQVVHPDLGVQITLGEVPVCTAEFIVEHRYPGQKDAPAARFYLGAGTTIGHLERRAISAALLDATCSRDGAADDVGLGMLGDPELLAPLLDGAAACGHIEHFKLPHHVQFQSKLDPDASAYESVEDQEA